MTDYAEGRVRPSITEEVRAMMRAYAALALAQHAAELFAEASAPDPRLASVIKCQALAVGELDRLLEKALSGVPQTGASDDAEEECPALLM